MQSFLLIFDIIYRVFRTFRIVHKHWSAVASSAPLIDIRASEDLLTRLFCSSKQVAAKSMSQSASFQLVVHFLAHFWIVVVVFFAFITIALSSLLYLYLPIYQSYVDNCANGGKLETDDVSSEVEKSSVPINMTRGNTSTPSTGFDFVLNQTQPPGTFLARNLNSMGYNYASMTGTSRLGRGISEYNRR